MTCKVGIYLFPEVEALDFAGPYEVFTTATRVDARTSQEATPAFTVFSVATDNALVRERAGMKIVPDFQLDAHPAIDILIVPGGVVTAELEKAHVADWIARVAASARITASVCTGAFLLAQARVLATHTVTTHWEDVADLRAQFPSLDVVTGVRWVDAGTVVTSAGISAGIDMSLHLVSREGGLPLAERTARQMEFEWTRHGLTPQAAQHR